MYVHTGVDPSLPMFLMKFQKLSVLMGLSGIRLRRCLSERCKKTHELQCVEIENALFHEMQRQWCQKTSSLWDSGEWMSAISNPYYYTKKNMQDYFVYRPHIRV
jgi:hypothetical protein